MHKYTSFIAALALAIMATLFVGNIAMADWDDDGLGGGSLGINLGPQSTNATIDLHNCVDGKVATWHKTNLTFQIVSPLGLDVQSVRAGVLEWNNVGAPYSLTEVSSSSKADITIQVVPLISLTTFGQTNVSCQTGAGGIQSVAIRIGINGLLPAVLRNVSAHEVGHALGLGHAAVPGSRNDLMAANFALLPGSLTVLCPSNLDVAALTAKADPYTIPASSWARKSC